MRRVDDAIMAHVANLVSKNFAVDRKLISFANYLQGFPSNSYHASNDMLLYDTSITAVMDTYNKKY